MSECNYEEWEGTGGAFSGMVFTIDENRRSLKEIHPDEWGSLEDYIPQDLGILSATRTVGKDDEGKYIQVSLSDGWNNRLRPRVEALQFRFGDNPDYDGKLASLKDFKIQIMDSGEQIGWDEDDWKPIESYPVELYKTKKPDGALSYSLKLYFEKKNEPNKGLKVGAFWCWR